ncbi:MAG: ABC transporter permease [Burkholderiales bacterium]|nr:ABC transporter permease [Phycisphaerae bacterium]
MNQIVTVILLIIALAVGSQMSPYFLDAGYLLKKTSMEVPIAIMAIALTFVIIGGHIDLSVATGTVLVSVIAARSFDELHLPMAMVVVVALSCGALLGAFNGLLVVWLRIPSLVATLGTLALFRGLSKILIEERTIRGFPDWFLGLHQAKLLGTIPLPVIVMLGLAIIAAIVLRFTTFGRTVIAIGTSEPAARYSALPTARTTMLLFVISGVAMGVAALANIAQIGSVDYKGLPGGELIAITAVVLGGTSIFGGRGSVLGTVLAMFLLVVVRSALGMRNVQVENQLPIIGTLLIVAVAIADLPAKLLARLKARRRNIEGTGTKPGATIHA